MAVDIVMPQMGESIFEGTITKWLKKPGDKVERDEPLFEISTDKVDAEIPSPSAGVLKEIKVGEGKTVPIQTVVGVIDAADGAAPAAAPGRCAPQSCEPAKAAPPAPATQAAKPAAAPPPPRSKLPGPRRHSRCPRARWRAHSQLAARSPHGEGARHRPGHRSRHGHRRPHQQAGHRGAFRRRRHPPADQNAKETEPAEADVYTQPVPHAIRTASSTAARHRRLRPRPQPPPAASIMSPSNPPSRASACTSATMKCNR